jgi:hypothetical protein
VRCRGYIVSLARAPGTQRVLDGAASPRRPVSGPECKTPVQPGSESMAQRAAAATGGIVRRDLPLLIVEVLRGGIMRHGIEHSGRYASERGQPKGHILQMVQTRGQADMESWTVQTLLSPKA